jgi:hypothetical protein
MPGSRSPKKLDYRSKPGRCPYCDEIVNAGSMNIDKGLALCSNCNKLSRLSHLNFSGKSMQELIAAPPAGCRVESIGQAIRLTTSNASKSLFLGATAFALIWNSCVSLFVLKVAGSIYNHSVGALPDWFPAAGIKEGIVQHDGHAMSVGDTLFSCLLLIPFLLVGVCIVLAALMIGFGRMSVYIDEASSYVSPVLGRPRNRKYFDMHQVRSIDLEIPRLQAEGGWNFAIEIESDRSVKIDYFHNDEQMWWMFGVLKILLQPSERLVSPASSAAQRWLAAQSLVHGKD